MKQKKIHPYLIDDKRLAGYYELLLEDGFELRIFDKKKDKEINSYFLPVVKDYLFWTFNLNTKESMDEYKQMPNDLKAAVCSRYSCNVFTKKDDTVICFDAGVCFAITDNDKTLQDVTKYEQNQKMQEINLRDEDYYKFDDMADKSQGKVQDGESNLEAEKCSKISEEHQFAYILELYKMIYLKKINKEIQDPDLFNKARSEFVEFTQDIYVLKETDKDKYCEDLASKLGLERLYLLVENQFDLLYKNNKLDDNINTRRFFILLLVVGIIIGIINLFNEIM